jgi:hypothetical protein
VSGSTAIGAATGLELTRGLGVELGDGTTVGLELADGLGLLLGLTHGLGLGVRSTSA